jgi:hypothetical protein
MMFNFKIDAEVTHMFFFKGDKSVKTGDDYNDADDNEMLLKNEIYLKKNYLYITTDNEVCFRNLGVAKKSTSALTRQIFWNDIIPRIKSEKRVKFPKTFYRNLVTEYLLKNIEYAFVRYNVRSVNDYKNSSQLQAQISERYGSGIHFLIPNSKIGVGKGKKYCTYEEFKNAGMVINDINLDNVFRELEYFTEPKQKINLSNFM